MQSKNPFGQNFVVASFVLLFFFFESGFLFSINPRIALNSSCPDLPSPRAGTVGKSTTLSGSIFQR